MFSRRSLPLLLILILAASAAAFAQESQTPTTTQTPSERGIRPGRMREGKDRRFGERERMGRIGRPGFGHRGAFRDLNLTAEQQQQRQAIVQRHLEGIKAQREELMKMREKRNAGTFTEDDAARARVLRQEIHNSMRSLDTEVEGILTAEQRTRLEQLKSDHKARREEMLKRRQERRENIPQ